MRRPERAVAVAATLVLLAGGPGLAQVAMPDPTQIAGRAIPAPELPDGTVSVRLVREELGNNIAGHPVTVAAGGASRSGTTDDNGRALITGLAAGATATAEAIVDGERLVSQPFDVPSRGGVRVILISGLAQLVERRKQEQDAAANAPPVKGIVVFGGDSRIILEFQDDTLRVFYLLEIVNTGRAPVDTGGPLLLDLPSGAVSTAVLQGSFPGASASGDRVTIRGPFPPGTSQVQIGFRLLYGGSEATIAQRFPAVLERVSVVLEKVGAAHMTSPQFAEHGDVRARDGTPFLLGTGGALAAGAELTLRLTGLPNDSTWPRNLALGLALAIFAAGAWLAFGGAKPEDARRRLAARRDALYSELVKLEEQHRAGRVDEARYHSRRQQLVAELERIYGELDGAPETGRAA